MAVTYTWKVESVMTRTEGDNVNAVVQTYWSKTGTDEDGDTATFSGGTPFTAADVPAGEFIPFEDLTEEIVLEWIKAAQTDFAEKHVNESIQKGLKEKKNPFVNKALPWAPATPYANT